MTLVRTLRGGRLILPSQARKALDLKDGDYLDLEISGSTVTLKRMPAINRAQADRNLSDIRDRVTYAGSESAPNEDDVMEMVLEEIQTVRGRHAKSGA